MKEVIEVVELKEVEDSKHRASVAEDYVQNLYESVAMQAPKQEGEGMREGVINYETQAKEDVDMQ